MNSDPLAKLAEALRLIRTRKGLTQTAASQRPGAPDYRTLSHWETRRKIPSLKLLSGYLASLDLDFCDLQEALDQVCGDVSTATAERLSSLAARLVELEALPCRLEELETRLGIIELEVG